ncbi:acyl carrier protein (plasmid) [Streptomyces sp. NBC_00335]|uniref:acyl carrier protein n=1 Tax=unclassified Streptomyces TaxID=2593676 RepID=UPI0022571BD7|nr:MULTISPECIES: acyl carrier protein [unclassified Streptomyces]MCX5410062.1 acyl carrier protein [Streptomyces sp. NBC_00086]
MALRNTTTWLERLPDLPALRAADTGSRVRIIEQYICQELTETLDIPPAYRINVRRPLRSQGVDSIMAIQLKRKLETALGVTVKAADLLRDDSVAEVAALLCALMPDRREAQARFAATASAGR